MLCSSLAHVAPIAHPGRIGADELSSIAQALKHAEMSYPPTAQDGRTCSANVAHASHQ